MNKPLTRQQGMLIFAGLLILQVILFSIKKGVI
jgi:hypothetical protein